MDFRKFCTHLFDFPYYYMYVVSYFIYIFCWILMLLVLVEKESYVISLKLGGSGVIFLEEEWKVGVYVWYVDLQPFCSYNISWYIMKNRSTCLWWKSICRRTCKLAKDELCVLTHAWCACLLTAKGEGIMPTLVLFLWYIYMWDFANFVWKLHFISNLELLFSNNKYLFDIHTVELSY